MVVGWIWADSWDSQNGSAQIVDLLEKTRSCQNIKKYPLNVEAATRGLKYAFLVRIVNDRKHNKARPFLKLNLNFHPTSF